MFTALITVGMVAMAACFSAAVGHTFGLPRMRARGPWNPIAALAAE
jgi:hypothetical protein